MLHLLPDNPLKAIVNLPAVSRAFGDRLLKKYVVAEPDVLEESLTGDDTLLIMATDGLWDVVSNQDAISMVRVRTFVLQLTACQKAVRGLPFSSCLVVSV